MYKKIAVLKQIIRWKKIYHIFLQYVYMISEIRTSSSIIIINIICTKFYFTFYATAGFFYVVFFIIIKYTTQNIISMHYFHFISCMGLHRIVSKKNSHSNHVYQMRILMIICAEIIVCIYLIENCMTIKKITMYLSINSPNMYRLKVDKKNHL